MRSPPCAPAAPDSPSTTPAAGYAGLIHILRLQPDIIKLDRTLTTGVDTDPAKAPLISSFVRYARDIDATVCAEGVETLQELERLADLDIAYGQGYSSRAPPPPGRPSHPRQPPPVYAPSRPASWTPPTRPTAPTTTAGSSAGATTRRRHLRDRA